MERRDKKRNLWWTQGRWHFSRNIDMDEHDHGVAPPGTRPQALGADATSMTARFAWLAHMRSWSWLAFCLLVESEFFI